MSDFIHIVCLDAPSPPNYGGAIDMYYKIKALGSIGKKIILHYFDYQPFRNAAGLEDLCTAIYSYKRKPVHRSLPITQPYIINSRINQQLIDQLNQDEYPILLEGLHCAGISSYLKRPERVIIRMHNEEASYYHHLAKTTTSLFKRTYFSLESKLLQRYQQRMDKNIKLACLSDADLSVFSHSYGFKRVRFIPCFIPWQSISGQQGSGTYCLYHGNLSVSENEEAAMWLIQQVFSALQIPLIIVGKGITKRLADTARQHQNISLIYNPAISEIDRLVHDAHINVLPSMNSTGVKLKLLNALFNGRHCITNFNGVKGSKLTQNVTIAESPAEWINAIQTLLQKPFDLSEINRRKEIMSLYSNKINAEQLSALW